MRLKGRLCRNNIQVMLETNYFVAILEKYFLEIMCKYYLFFFLFYPSPSNLVNSVQNLNNLNENYTSLHKLFVRNLCFFRSSHLSTGMVKYLKWFFFRHLSARPIHTATLKWLVEVQKQRMNQQDHVRPS